MASLLQSFERCCRLCAEEQEVTIMIFGKESEAMLLKNKLNKYLLIEVDENDKLPKNLCFKCCSKLHTLCDFIDTAHRAQEILHNQSLLLEHENSANNSTKRMSNNKVMEISLDPMVVLQNSEEFSSSESEENLECKDDDIVHLHGLDGGDVTIRLIKKGEISDDKNYLNEKPFPCYICHRGFFTELALKNHSWMHSNEEKSATVYKCGTCRENFVNKQELMVHAKKHKFAYCQLCGRLFRSQINLENHMEAHKSSRVKAFTCKICGRAYNSISNLKTHSVTHSNERPYHCPYCKKSFKRNQDLKFHINQHTGARPYKCPFCDKRFASSGNCYSHKSRMHPGKTLDEVDIKRRLRESTSNQVIKLRPIAPKASNFTPVKAIMKYQCTMCNHTFLRRDNFKYHMYKHTGEKPYQCSFCSDNFVTRRGLSIHHEKTHPNEDRPLALLSKNALLR